MAAARGTLFLVVGPSGVGKDSILDGVRAKLAGDPRFVFPRRVITRAAGAIGEDHVPMDEETFEEARASGAFALSWAAHGQAYGLPASIGDDLAQGRNVVANVSRSVIADARRRFAPVRVLSITARPDTLRRRLEARGRESAAEIAERLERAVAFDASGPGVVKISNDGPLEDAVNEMISALLMPAL